MLQIVPKTVVFTRLKQTAAFDAAAEVHALHNEFGIIYISYLDHTQGHRSLLTVRGIDGLFRGCSEKVFFFNLLQQIAMFFNVAGEAHLLQN